MTQRSASSKWAAYCKLLGISGVVAASLAVGVASGQQEQKSRASDRSSEQDESTRRNDTDDSERNQSDAQRRRRDAQSEQDRAYQSQSSQNRNQQESQYGQRSQSGESAYGQRSGQNQYGQQSAQSGRYGQQTGRGQSQYGQARPGQSQDFNQQGRLGQTSRDQQERFGQSDERSANVNDRSRQSFRDDQFGSQRGQPFSQQSGQESDSAWLGVYLRESQTNEDGAQVTHVYPAGPAARAGLRAGDVITAVDGQRVSSTEELIRTIEEQQPGARAQLSLTRNNQRMELPITLGSRQSFAWQRPGEDWGMQGGYASSRPGGEDFRSGQGDEDHWSNVPPFAMQLEHERRMYEQHQRIETQIAQLQQEIRQLREELRQRR